ncbi:hypothetical protein ACFYLX_18885 [Pseudarthrobacter enclensis]|jgi:hypothetical protein|uniref:hypothetical protein n=1 Tax=Pseudarthrobacter enclensis TaxID=993070 RepID=UPI0036BCE672
MSAPNDEPLNTADLRGPGDPEEAGGNREPGATAPQTGQHPDQPHAGNIREEQQAHAAGAVPASYVGSGDATADGPEAGAAGEGQESKPEDALKEQGTWDDEV